MSDEEKYRLRYKLDPARHPTAGGWTKEELLAEGFGGCDAVIMHSLLFPPDGSLRVMTVSCDGRTGEDLDVNQLFKAWFLLAKQLSERKDLSPQKREFANMVYEMIRQAIVKTSPPTDGSPKV